MMRRDYEVFMDRLADLCTNDDAQRTKLKNLRRKMQTAQFIFHQKGHYKGLKAVEHTKEPVAEMEVASNKEEKNNVTTQDDTVSKEDDKDLPTKSDKKTIDSNAKPEKKKKRRLRNPNRQHCWKVIKTALRQNRRYRLKVIRTPLWTRKWQRKRKHKKVNHQRS